MPLSRYFLFYKIVLSEDEQAIEKAEVKKKT